MGDIGDILREARLRRGLEIGDCESATKIRGKYLRALEEEQYEALPGHTFVRGFLKTYADMLELDGAAMVDAYEAEHQPVREPSGLEEVLRRGRTRRRSRESRLLMVLSIITLAVATTVWALVDGPTASASEASPVTVEFATAGRQPTYVEAHEGSATGPLLFTPGNIEPDLPVTVETHLPIVLHVGDGSGLALTVDDAPLTMPAATGDFTVTTERDVLTRGPVP